MCRRACFLPSVVCRTGCNVRISATVWILNDRYLHSGTVSVCNISARNEMRNHTAPSHTGRMVRKVWRRSSAPTTSLVYYNDINLCRHGCMRLFISLGRFNDVPQLWFSHLWFPRGYGRVVGYISSQWDSDITMESHDEVWRRFDSPARAHVTSWSKKEKKGGKKHLQCSQDGDKSIT